MFEGIEFARDDDGWEYRMGCRFATPDECDGLGRQVGLATRSMMTDSVLYDAFVLAADKQGRIVNHEIERWYEKQVTEVMRDEDDDSSWSLTYDRFTFGVLMDSQLRLVAAGYLATRGNGDSVSYRLTLPS